MRIAVVGCAHGELDKIYATIKHMEQSEGLKIDLLLCCGDFQAVRNEIDLDVLACPPKYRSMNSFWKYYSGKESAPCTTIFIGGNHEASNYLWELYYGGWVAPNIYYLGAAGVVTFGGLRIGGLSGIYKAYDYRSGHFERAPYDDKEKHSIFHVREYDVQKLMEIAEPIDIFMSHDWPRGIARCGDMEQLLRRKPFLQQEIADNALGSEPANKLLVKLKPTYWFAAHLHTKFSAVVHHPGQENTTKFLALDKCLPGRPFLQVLEMPATCDGALEVAYDKEWLAITRAYNSSLPLQRTAIIRPCSDLLSHRNWVENLALQTEAHRPPPFQHTVPAFDPLNRQSGVALHVRNPQTEAFLKLLELPYMLDTNAQRFQGAFSYEKPPADPNEISLDEEDDGNAAEDPNGVSLVDKEDGLVKDPNEISLEDDSADLGIDEKAEFSQAAGAAGDPNEILLSDDE